ncbi:hypothetical protein G5I_00534 [Acromyrmex echinatior]|uniref:Uncharacterized protein n=1 Tax=Acromyrmex echinatior TaxID=103372 RepID=F4W543_ACREC|nr:hypothetical protein G5I_00534 [Acromyrmex echinatior]
MVGRRRLCACTYKTYAQLSVPPSTTVKLPAGIEMRYEASGSPRERLRLIADNRLDNQLTQKQKRLEIKPSVLDHQQAENRT